MWQVGCATAPVPFLDAAGETKTLVLEAVAAVLLASEAVLLASEMAIIPTSNAPCHWTSQLQWAVPFRQPSSFCTTPSIWHHASSMHAQQESWLYISHPVVRH
eukprot:1147581-Pelagomonas_calceolata.AAC.9